MERKVWVLIINHFKQSGWNKKRPDSKIRS
jgi:hypothetical protein